MSKTDIGIDLGTANTVITLGKKGVVLSEPSAIAYHKRTKEGRCRYLKILHPVLHFIVFVTHFHSFALYL